MYIRVKTKKFKFEYKETGIYFNLSIFKKDLELTIENQMLGLIALFG